MQQPVLAGTLYERLLGHLQDLPNIAIVEAHTHEPTIGFFRASGGTAGFYFRSLGIVTLGFERKRRRTFQFSSSPIQRNSFVNLNDVMRELERVPELGKPIAADKEFLFYERLVDGTDNPKEFEMVAAGTRSLYLHIQMHHFDDVGGLQKMVFAGHPILDKYLQGLTKRYYVVPNHTGG